LALANPRTLSILELVEYGYLQGLDCRLDETHQTLFLRAKSSFLVTDNTANDYATLAIHILTDPIRTELELRVLRNHRLQNRKRR
jgi:hypothetical protein